MQAVLHGLMLTAVVVVAQAVWNMVRSLTPDLPRRTIAVVACVALLYLHGGPTQLVILAGGAVVGAILCRPAAQTSHNLPPRLNSRSGWIAFGAFLALLGGLSTSVIFTTHGPFALASIFYRSGAFVFGGGHVVLPLLQQALVPTHWISADRFLAGYGFAQAVPGPLFTVAAYLGAASAPPHQSLLWALLAVTSIFLPGLLLAVTGLSLLDRIANSKIANAMLAGINAAVVGLLAAALCNPVWTGAVRSVLDVGIVLMTFALLMRFKSPPVLVVVLCVGASMVL
jgi:chromate transporter